jgi:hypothetical protein
MIEQAKHHWVLLQPVFAGGDGGGVGKQLETQRNEMT